jgi:hypothetical protein
MDNLTNPWGAPTLLAAQFATACGRRVCQAGPWHEPAAWLNPTLDSGIPDTEYASAVEMPSLAGLALAAGRREHGSR